MKRYDDSLKYFIGYSKNGNIYQNLYIGNDDYYNIISDYFNRPIKQVQNYAAGTIAQSILNKDKVIKEAYEKTLPI